MQTFPEIRKKLGFGCMRLPMIGEEVDIEQFKAMTDRFIEEGFDYFDTAHGYIRGKSELAIKEALTSRYPREAYLLTDKLTGTYFEKEEDIRPLFQSQLEACGVDYFDFYLMHAQHAEVYEKFKACHAYETAFELKKEGKIRHVGISFHDSPEVLDRILTDYPQLDIVQIQFNYLDQDDPNVMSRAVYEVCEKHDKPVLVMEPVKGGKLVNLPQQAQQYFDELQGGSNASYAIRYAAGFKNIAVVLSGMSTLDQLIDNVSYMKDFQPLSEQEHEAVKKVVEVFHSINTIPCTNCRYCVEENSCPMDIHIPDFFRVYNNHLLYHEDSDQKRYEDIASRGSRAADCVQCGMCEAVCPQHLPIRDLLIEVSAHFD